MIIIEAYKEEEVIHPGITPNTNDKFYEPTENTRIAVIKIEFLDKYLYRAEFVDYIVDGIGKLLKGENENIWIQELEDKND